MENENENEDKNATGLPTSGQAFRDHLAGSPTCILVFVVDLNLRLISTIVRFTCGSRIEKGVFEGRTCNTMRAHAAHAKMPGWMAQVFFETSKANHLRPSREQKMRAAEQSSRAEQQSSRAERQSRAAEHSSRAEQQRTNSRQTNNASDRTHRRTLAKHNRTSERATKNRRKIDEKSTEIDEKSMKNRRKFDKNR